MKKISFAFICFLVFIRVADAQDVISSVTGSFSYATLSPEQVAAMNPLMLALEKKNVTLSIVKNDTPDIAKLAVMAGTAPGSNDVFYKEFVYAAQGDFPDGTSCHASGNTITIGTGTLNGMPKYFISVYAILENGDRTSQVKYLVQ